MRGDLAAAVLHDPPLLYLDEPTIGLDLVAKARVRDFLAEINRERGVTILLTTHDLADVEALCRRMLVIDHGRLLYDGAIEELRRRYGTHRTLVVDLDGGWDPAAPPPAGAELIKTEGSRAWLRFDRATASAADLIAAVAVRTPLGDVAIEEPAIEEIVRRIYGEGAETVPSPVPLRG
jgi:ABC-2 type transport system ATP-binding protein